MTWRGALADRGVRRRALLFVGVALFLNFGPAFTYATGIQMVPFWQMYNAYGQGICRVSLHERADDGTLSPIDRFAALGVERDSARRRIRRIRNRDDAIWLAKRLCRGPYRGGDVRMTLDCGAPEGWRRVEDLDDVNVCELVGSGRER
jgi:hypothetical protein